MTTATQHDPSGNELAQVEYTHDPYGRVTGLDRGNGVTTRYDFTSVNQIAAETTTGPDGTVLTERTYAYDARGNLTQRVDSTTPPTKPSTNTLAAVGTDADRDAANSGQEPSDNATASTSSSTTTTTVYRYDNQDRLTESAVHDGPDTRHPSHHPNRVHRDRVRGHRDRDRHPHRPGHRH